MLHKTKGIALSYIPYKESSIITHILTEKFGLQTYIENNVKTIKGRKKLSYFQPLTLLDLVVYHNEKKDINRISELAFLFLPTTLSVDLKKAGMVMFLTEIIQKSLLSHVHNEALFSFIENAIMLLDHTMADYEDFHIHFMHQMSFYLGFGSRDIEDFTQPFLDRGIAFSQEHTALLQTLFRSKFGERCLSNRAQRNWIIDTYLSYYGFFNERFQNIKSIEVLRALND